MSHLESTYNAGQFTAPPRVGAEHEGLCPVPISPNVLGYLLYPEYPFIVELNIPSHSAHCEGPRCGWWYHHEHRWHD